MKKMLLHRFLALLSIIVISTIMVGAETEMKGRVKIEYEPMADGGIKVINVWNYGDKWIELNIDGEKIRVLAASSQHPNKYAHRFVKYESATGSGEPLWKAEPKEATTVVETSPSVVAETSEAGAAADAIAEQNREGRQASGRTEHSEGRSSAVATVGYGDRINQDEFFGMDAVMAYTQKVEDLCRAIESSKNKSQFIIDNDINLFLEESEREINEHRSNLGNIAKGFFSASNVGVASQNDAMTLIVGTLNDRLKTRETAYNKLKTLVINVGNNEHKDSNGLGGNVLNYVIVVGIVLALVIMTVAIVRLIKFKQKSASKSNTRSVPLQEAMPDNPTIIIRRRTTSMLKRLCIDDVIDNPAYMLIKASDFTPDSAVDKIYIKNTCIKDIYNLYAEDLRNTDNPKEDGCMVLGRWVRNDANDTYDITLEEVVFPGDDAVFKEYELNFGGKIKLRIVERLRKLRRDTNLQYDLVCWIHSHPGLGVFFSNSDNNVQMQLKHSEHPNFLIAFVVDILTSNQEMGIFTFRKDGTINSKNDLTKMYSLEEMYKWALQSERSSFSKDNYFNILDNAKLKLPPCVGVELNNSSIIDLAQIVVEPETGIVGWAIGTTIENEGKHELVVSSIVRHAEKPLTGVIGCLISMSHMSFPTIQRLISRDIVNLSFVMIYSSKMMSLTTVPVINGELISDEQFYGDVNIDDLKIWTRRKR